MSRWEATGIVAVTEIVIHRCQLRIVRRGGWSWGPDPKRLVDDVIAMLPNVLAERLARLFPGEETREYSRPVQVRIRLHAGELAPMLGARTSDAPRPEAAHFEILERKVEAELRAALRIDLPLDVAGTPALQRLQPEAIGAPPVVSAAPEALTRCEGLLLSWAERGVLEQRLALIAEEQIVLWHDALWMDPGTPLVPATVMDPQAAEELERLIRTAVPPGDAGPQSRRRVRLLAGFTAAARLRVSPQSAALRAALDRYMPIPEPGDRPQPRVSPAVSPPNAIASGAGPASVLEQVARSGEESALPDAAARARPSSWEALVPCALPFLLLPPLARVDYLDAVAAALEASGLTAEAPLFAAALAHKVLDAPLRGWRRTPAALASAAAFTGRREPIPEQQIVDFARRIARHTSVLDAVIADALLSGHTPGTPLLLHSADMARGGPLLLLDCEGAFPIAWAPELATLLPHLRRLPSEAILVSAEGATPGLLAELEAAGLTWIADAPPTRGEQQRRIQQGTTFFGWTNSQRPSSSAMLGAGRRLMPASADAARLCAELLCARPAAVRAASSELDQSLLLAASMALGTIAWKLWRERGPTHPAQVLERFCDLGARVRFDDSTVAVILPLGRRHAELRDAGLLLPIRAVPWLGGRSVEFAGG